MRAGGVPAGLHRGSMRRTTYLDRPESKVRAHRHPLVQGGCLAKQPKVLPNGLKPPPKAHVHHHSAVSRSLNRRAVGVPAGLHCGWTERTTYLDRPDSMVRMMRMRLIEFTFALYTTLAVCRCRLSPNCQLFSPCAADSNSSSTILKPASVFTSMWTLACT